MGIKPHSEQGIRPLQGWVPAVVITHLLIVYTWMDWISVKWSILLSNTACCRIWKSKPLPYNCELTPPNHYVTHLYKIIKAVFNIIALSKVVCWQKSQQNAWWYFNKHHILSSNPTEIDYSIHPSRVDKINTKWALRSM